MLYRAANGGMVRTIADFDLIRELGRGGMGVVYEAIEKPLGRRVALKLLHPEHAQSPEGCARMLEEARKVARLDHPSIVRIHRVGEFERTYFLALEFIDGEPLDTILAREALPLSKDIEILKTVAEALMYTHARKIVHRDLKPGNLFMRSDGRVVLGDFGIAKDFAQSSTAITANGLTVGTPAYMSPEQALGKAVGPPSDVYSLGVLAFELFTGRVPFSADSAFELLRKHVQQPAPQVSDLVGNLPMPLTLLVDAMLDKDPARRPTCAEVIAALERHEPGPDSTLAATRPLTDATQLAIGVHSSFDELEVTVASFRVRGFTRDLCQSLLPPRVAFVLESWYRLAHQSIVANGGVVDRYVADNVTALFGFPDRHADHVQRALGATRDLFRATATFNKAHDLKIEATAGIACGPALVGHVVGDVAPTSVQGPLLGDMRALAMRSGLEAPARLNRSAYRRVANLASFARVEDPTVGEIWTTGF